MLRRASLLVVFATALGTAALLPAQCPPPAWSSMNHYQGIGGFGNAVTVWDPDGSGPLPPLLAVGGGFTLAGTTSANHVVTWDGMSWQPLGNGVPWPVTALTSWNGNLVAGGAGYVSKWDGVSWQQLGTGVSLPGSSALISALAVYNGDLIAAGHFALAGGLIANNVARWNGFSWQPLGDGVNGAVSALDVYNGDLVAAGAFTASGVFSMTGFARWNGSSWQGLGPNLAMTGTALCLFNGDLIAAGSYNFAGAANYAIARWNGSGWSFVGQPLSFAVHAFVVYNGQLYAKGLFYDPAYVYGGGIARWDGTAWQPLGGGLWPGNSGALAVYNSDMIAVGDFSVAGGGSAFAIARWNGSVWQPFEPGLNATVLSLTEYAGALVAGTQYGVTQWNGADWQPVGSGMNGGVSALTVHGGELYAGGWFTIASSIAVNSLTRWTGSGWAPLGAGLGGSAYPSLGAPALASFNGGLVAGGNFTSAGGVAVNNIASWNGSSWAALGAGTGFVVRALAVYNSELIAGGDPAGAAGAATSVIARWNGGTWQPLGAGIGGGSSGPGNVFALAVYNGELIAGGNFTSAGGGPANFVARWNGSTWQPLGAGTSDVVFSLRVHQGTLIAGGSFLNAGGQSADRIARWDGISWQPLGTGMAGSASNSAVYALMSHDGALFAGGTFSMAGGLASPLLARWSSPLPLLAFSQPNGNGAGVLVTNRWLIPGHEYYNIASLMPCSLGPGTGPYAGLCFPNLADLTAQTMLPIGVAPFHVLASATDASYGPYSLPVGLSIEAISADVTGGVLGCISPVVPWTVY